MQFRSVPGILVFCTLLLQGNFLAAQSSLLSPLPDTVITSPDITFTWEAASGAGGHFLHVGTLGTGSLDVHNSGYLSPAVQSYTLTGVPPTEILYVRLLTESFPGSEKYSWKDYEFAVDLPPIAYALELSDSRRLAVLQSRDFSSMLSNGMSQSEAMAIGKVVYAQFADDFDFIIVASHSNSGVSSPYAGLFIQARNSVKGIGKALFDNSADFGSTGRLQGVLHLTNPLYLRAGPSLHELGHNWGNYLDSIPTDSVFHWGASNIGGQLGGWKPGSLVDLGDGRYSALHPVVANEKRWGLNTNGGNSVPYSEFELYLMGLLAPEAIDQEIRIAADFAWIDQPNGIFAATSIDTFSMTNLITAEGTREPGVAAAQKSFRALYLLLTEEPVAAADLAAIDFEVERFSATEDDFTSVYNFWEATGGRASIVMDNLQFKSGSSGNSYQELASATGAPTSASLDCPGSVAGKIQFTSNQPATLACSFGMQSQDQGKQGSAYIVIVTAEGGLFALQESGTYLPWNGEAQTLQPYQQAIVGPQWNVAAFENIRFADFGISELAVAVYFAYSVAGSDDLVYSKYGIQVSINPP